MKPQIMFIHGGEPHDSYEEFLEYLKTAPIRNPFYTGPKPRWKDGLAQTFMHETDVLYPTMPNKHNARYSEWKFWFERHFEYITRDIILIGHSLGGAFLAQYLSENNTPFHVKALFLVSAPYWTENKPNPDFHGFVLNSAKILQLANTIDSIAIIHSKEDEVVPVSHGTLYKNALPEAKYIEFEDRGHFLQESFPEIIAEVEAHM